MITTNTTNSTSVGIQIKDEGGSTREACRVSSSIRAGRMVSVVVDMHDREDFSAHFDEITQQVMTLISDAFGRAAAQGLPVAAMSGVNSDGSC